MRSKINSQEEKQAVCAILFSEDRQQILLVKRRDIPVWVLPGGGKESDETASEGAIREFEEETGLKVRIVRQIALYLPVNKLTQLTHFFECCAIGGHMIPTQETQEIRFFPIHQLPLLPPPYPGWIADALADHPQMLRKHIEGVSYWILFKLLLRHPILVVRYLLTKIGIHLNDRESV